MFYAILILLLFFSPCITVKNCWRSLVSCSSPSEVLSSFCGWQGPFVLPQQQWDSDEDHSLWKGLKHACHPHLGPRINTDVHFSFTQSLMSHFQTVTLLHPHLLSHLDAHVRAADLRLGGGTCWRLRCWAPVGPGFRRFFCDWGVCQRDVYGWWICGGEFSGWRWGGGVAFSGWCIRIDLCDRANRNM